MQNIIKSDIKSVDDQKTELRTKCKKVIIDGKLVLFAPKGLTVTNKIFNNAQYSE